MSRRFMTSIAAVTLAWACLAAACGGPHSGSPFDGVSGGDDGGGNGGGSSSGGLAPGGGDSGGLSLGTGSSGGASSSGGTALGCDPTCTAAGGKCASNVCTLTENTGNLPSATQTQLQGSGTADSGFVWLYPYDKTVFPRGLLSPTMQFGGGASDAEFVHITSKTLDYRGYFAGGTAGNVKLNLPQKSWAAVAAAVGAGDSASVKVTKLSGSSVSGPISETWPIAQGTIRGTVFYETYGSAVAGGRNSVAILRINPGATAPTVFQGASGACGAICHAASADGSTIVSATSLGASASWNVQSGASVATANNTTFTYMGLYPDGSFGMTSTNYGAIYTTNTTSRLFDTRTGATIAAPGWDSTINAAGTPSFSPDGKQIAFMREDQDGHTVAKADFAASTKTFSNISNLAAGASGYVAWPAFTPDGKSVLYQVGSDSTFETDCQYTGDLYAVDVATKTVRRLDVLDGYTGSGTASYLPAGDPGLNFAPTMLAEGVGGYFWAIFTSHRSYGSLLASKADSMGLGVSNCFSAAGDEANGKLWLAAIDINAAPGTDPSHPAFYLDGQELQADNLRGYWVLPACAKEGIGCGSGDECCSGFCRGESGNTPVCVTKPSGCSMEFESCTTSSDCCTSSDLCINGRCATPAAPQ
jgi:WD40 repeat protein